MNDGEVLELVKARMAEVEASSGGGARTSSDVDAASAKVAATTRKKAETKYKSAAERMDFMQRELAKAVCGPCSLTRFCQMIFCM